MVDLHKKFPKSDLLAICNELDLSDVTGLQSIKLVKAIVEDLETNGYPPEDECSDLLNDFIDALDEEPEVVEVEEPKEYTKEIIPLEVAEEDLPDCYTMADERDPACKRCKVFQACMQERITIRENDLPCFGKLYSSNAEECKVCLEAGPCRLVCQK